jgi:Lrp/AsnC family leucine-responsive transcriptional regulator
MPKSIHTAPQNDAARAKRAPPQVKLRLDDVDLLILSALQEDAHLSNADIGRHVGMVPSGVFERIRKLEKAKVITGYEARLDANALNFPLAAFVFVKAAGRSGHPARTAAQLARIPEVQEVHTVAGEDRYLLKVRAQDTKHLGRLLRDKITTIKFVVSTRTIIVLETVKETSAIPLGHSGDC